MNPRGNPEAIKAFRFTKGKSGNPNGRSKKVLQAERRLDDLTVEAAEVFAKSLKNGSLRAAEKVIDHRVPRVPEVTELTGEITVIVKYADD